MDILEYFYAIAAVSAALFVKPLIWTPLLFGLDRLAGLIGPKFRKRVSGHYAGQPLSYFYFAQSLGPIETQKYQDQIAHQRHQRSLRVEPVLEEPAARERNQAPR